MAVGDRFRDLFRGKGARELTKPERRRAALEEAFEESRRAAAERLSTPEIRRPFAALAEAFEEAGLDPTEVYAYASRLIPSDDHWREELVRTILAKPRIAASDLPHLEKEATQRKTSLTLWQRLVNEAAIADPGKLPGYRHRAIVVLHEYFPAENQTRWPDRESAAAAWHFFKETLDAAFEANAASGASDLEAMSVARIKLKFDPENPAALLHLSRIFESSGRRDFEAATIGLRALMANPADERLRYWIGNVLAQTPGYEEEGLELLRQVKGSVPGRPEGGPSALVSHIKSAGRVEPRDLDALRQHLAAHPDDTRALELLADFFAERNDTSEEALAAYKAAAPTSPNRTRYIRLLGQIQTSRANWASVVDIFQDLRASGEDTEEVIIPLASAYAEFARSDSDAVAVYKRAIALGSLKPEVHELYCRHLYMRERSKPESVSQFKASLARFPKNTWARLGVLDHAITSGDYVTALDDAVRLLRESPRDLEAQKFAAHALAGNFGRQQMRRVEELPEEALVPVLERAYALNSDALPVAESLARRRLAAKVSNADTARLLGEICRRNPEALDLRFARARMLWDLGQRPNAIALFRELFERASVGASRGGGALAPEHYREMLRFLSEALMENPEPQDIDILLEASQVPGSPPSALLAAARLMVRENIEHPMRAMVLERAAALAEPEDETFEKATAEAKAQRGNPRPLLRLAIRRLERGAHDDETATMLRAVSAVVKPDTAGTEAQERLREYAERRVPNPELREAILDALTAATPASAENFKWLKSLADSVPNHSTLARRIAESAEAAGMDREAAEWYAKLDESDPESSDSVLLRRAHLNFRMQRHGKEQLPLAKRAYELAPDDPEVALHYASTLFECGDALRASTLLQTLLEEADDRIAARILVLLEGSARLATSQSDLLILLVKAYTRLGKIERALATLGRLQPHYQRLLPQLVECYSDLIARAPDNPQAHIERGILWRLVGHIAEASDDMAAAHALLPDNPGIAAEYAEVLAQRLAQENSRDASLWAKLAELHYLTGEVDEARTICERALSIAPALEPALHLLARLQLDAGRLDECRETLRRLPRSPKVFAMLQQLARAYEEKEDNAAAAEVLAQALDVSGEQREVIERLRDLHRKRAEVAAEAEARERVLAELSNKAQRRYELREEIGRGTMGLVYKAYDKELDEVVVLKILPEHFARDPEMLARFRNEAKAARKLAHPNIVRIHDIGEEDGRKHLSMEYVSGGDLKAAIREKGGPFPLSECVRIVREIARGLVHAHSEGVLHRDIKPANILLTPNGRVKISDFGIAALLQTLSGEAGKSQQPMDTQDIVAGTPLYMSPEQFSCEHPVGPPSDLYSLGLVFYELLCGMPPFTRGSISYHHQFTPPPRIPNLMDSVWEIVQKLLRKHPDERYQTAHSLLNELDNVDMYGRSRSSVALRKLNIPIGDMKTPVPGVDEKT